MTVYIVHSKGETIFMVRLPETFPQKGILPKTMLIMGDAKQPLRKKKRCPRKTSKEGSICTGTGLWEQMVDKSDSPFLVKRNESLL